MEGLVLILFIALLFTWAYNTNQRKRIDALDERLGEVTQLTNEVERLTGRVRVLQLRLDSAAAQDAVPEVPRVPEFPRVPEVQRVPVAPKVAAAMAVPVAPVVPVVPAEPAEHAPWEVVVGTSWLNKIGVLVVVVGVALFLGYSMAHVGPGGRVAIGYLLSAAMLGAGVVLERRPLFRNYAYGLVAGGWAGIYFTTYAAHAVEAAHVVDSQILATSGLALVAGGMIAHSLKYRSQTVTTLAYVVAYATMMLTPLTTFSVVASVPLAVSLLIVAQRFGWPGVSIFGLVSTYGLFILRTPELFAIPGSALPGEALNSYTAAPYLLLASYWIAFEAAEILAIRSRGHVESRVTPLFALNAIGFVGAALLEAPPDDPRFFSSVLAFLGVAYLGSAFVRARRIGRAAATDDQPAPFGSVQGAVAIAAALVAAATGLRFHGARETLALLIETEMLVAAGLSLGDAAIRRLGSILALVVTVHAVSLIPGRSWMDLPWLVHTSTPIASLVALSWYLNRMWLRSPSRRIGWLEWGYTWAALLLIGTIIGVELRPAYQGLAALVLAALLLEAGLRVGGEYRAQSYLAGAVGGWLVLVYYGALLPPASPAVWRVLPLSVALAYAMAVRILRSAPAGLSKELAAAAGTSAVLGTACLLVLEWRSLPIDIVAPAWALTAMALVGLGVWRVLLALRWQGYAVLFLAGSRSVGLLLERPSRDASELAWAAAVATLLYAGSILARHGARPGSTREAEQVERAAGVALALAGSGSVLVLQWRGLDPLLLGPGRVIMGAVMLAIGLWRRTGDLRWQGYGLIAIGAAMAMEPVVTTNSASAAAVAWVGLSIATLYAASLIGRRWLWSAGEPAGPGLERPCQLGLAVFASVLLAVTIVFQVRPSAVTLALGLQGAGLMAGGFLLRERVLRLSGLGLLLVCIAKLFASDVWELEALARIFSFVMLGVVLLAVSWVYTKFREQLLRFL